jgi:hypothetical protein
MRYVDLGKFSRTEGNLSWLWPWSDFRWPSARGVPLAVTDRNAGTTDLVYIDLKPALSGAEPLGQFGCRNRLTLDERGATLAARELGEMR